MGFCNFFKKPEVWSETLALVSAGASAVVLRQFTSLLDSVNPGNHEENLAMAGALGAGAYATGRIVGAAATWAFGLCCHPQASHSPNPHRGSTNAEDGAYGATYQTTI